ncbi:uncharacterized protein ASCRUDRAFT_73692 [Ascoidea rubescens DSM 1968]|uniref:Genetic interactor of prohibitin 5, mitochondrial n=1 Tax=Ascoidea rubescens DSM 1968 TaxID=1344418 RepID=A0A1D2VQX1_9ASCO|nr:hypothetical protein ASCRUDRAFT_73692 [Ascoidea rubescens DSM 1968]ODV63965.1 hypothetical protein ASCRUDRAFT_73692 [Ascoidea rubescens DSM 1968]
MLELQRKKILYLYRNIHRSIKLLPLDKRATANLLLFQRKSFDRKVINNLEYRIDAANNSLVTIAQALSGDPEPFEKILETAFVTAVGRKGAEPGWLSVFKAIHTDELLELWPTESILKTSKDNKPFVLSAEIDPAKTEDYSREEIVKYSLDLLKFLKSAKGMIHSRNLEPAAAVIPLTPLGLPIAECRHKNLIRKKIRYVKQLFMTFVPMHPFWFNHVEDIIDNKDLEEIAHKIAKLNKLKNNGLVMKNRFVLHRYEAFIKRQFVIFGNNQYLLSRTSNRKYQTAEDWIFDS